VASEKWVVDSDKWRLLPFTPSPYHSLTLSPSLEAQCLS
jgi:hypothetical protein